MSFTTVTISSLDTNIPLHAANKYASETRHKKLLRKEHQGFHFCGISEVDQSRGQVSAMRGVWLIVIYRRGERLLRAGIPCMPCEFLRDLKPDSFPF